MKLALAKRRYAGDWLAFKYSDVAREEGRVLAHDRSRSELLKKLPVKKRIRDIYVTYAGPPVPPGFSAILPLC